VAGAVICGWISEAIQYILQALTLAVVLGLALKLSGVDFERRS
jgi:hypothetical protein